jgi:S1-C subfamily serine protease
MKLWKVIIPAAAALLLAGQAAAQTDDDEQRLRAEEERLRATEARELEMDEKLRLAEERMAAAAREIAELTKERLPRMIEIEKRFAMTNKPMLGVTIETSGKKGPVEGVTLLGVTPGGAAADAGLRSGDVLTSVNDEALSAANCDEANVRLLDFMNGVEEGDVLTVEYLRDGKVGSVEIEPRIMSGNSFIWMDDKEPRHFDMHVAPAPPGAPGDMRFAFGFPWVDTALGKLELVELNEGLGRYFGTDKGLLVVNAPGSDDVDIRDGDVIQSIDGREPRDTRHAMRILGSYQAGEKLELGIMRDKKKMTIDIEIPADHRGSLQHDFEFEIRPAGAPGGPSSVPRPDDERIVIDVTS